MEIRERKLRDIINAMQRHNCQTAEVQYEALVERNRRTCFMVRIWLSILTSELYFVEIGGVQSYELSTTGEGVSTNPVDYFHLHHNPERYR